MRCRSRARANTVECAPGSYAGLRRLRADRLVAIEPVIEIEFEPNNQNEELLVEAKDQFEQLIQKVFARQEFNVSVKLPTDPVVLSFTIANMLHMENLAKQRLLETTDTMERMATLMPILQMQNLEAREPNYYRIGSEDLSEWITPN